MSNVKTLQQPVPWFVETWDYVSQIKNFEREDWFRYGCWIGTITSLLVGVSSFLALGSSRGVVYPGYVWFLPIGIGMFVSALALDDIGHRTLYKEDIKSGEAHVHQMIMITAVTSVMALCLCYEHGATFAVAAAALTALSFFYSAIDEALHWHRYLKKGVDRVEMWAHFVAITGHVLMMAAWWHWYREGYPGVAETLAQLPF